MKLTDFTYELPGDLIAQVPLEDRSSARLLVGAGVDEQKNSDLCHKVVSDLPDLLGPGDVVVLNDTRVFPARLRISKKTGGVVEILLLERRDVVCGIESWDALVRPSRRVKDGTVLESDFGLVVKVGDYLGQGRRLVQLESPAGVLTALEQCGEIPLPPYIQEPLGDPERYQTVYSNRPASVAAPTAGLHLTNEILKECVSVGARIERVELVVGLDTFRPITVENLLHHKMHSESYSVSQKTLESCRSARRVLAVGTTTVRALETAARGDLKGRTDLFIKRPFKFRVVDLLLTNFHMPRSTLLLLLDAFVGSDWREMYDIAIEERYRFLSFGDAMLVAREKSNIVR